MKFRSLILLCAMLGATWFTYAAEDSPTIKTKVYPAVYKSKSGPTQRVWVTINHSGKPASATLRLESQSQKVKLAEGENRFYFDVPVVNAPTKMHFTVSGAHSFSQDITVEPARHWQMNMVQHTHTDIGYTRSQMEILAEAASLYRLCLGLLRCHGRLSRCRQVQMDVRNLLGGQ